MALVPCPLSHALHLVVELGRYQRAAEEYPDAVPPDARTLQADLVRLSRSGVPTLLGVNRDGEPQLTFCTPRYEVVCGLTHQGDGYYAYRVSPLSLRNHDQIARHAVALMPRGWHLHGHVSELGVYVGRIKIPHQTGFKQIAAAWEAAQQAARRPHVRPAELSGTHLAFLSTVETLIDLAYEAELDRAARQAFTPVVTVEPVARVRMAGDVYRFVLAAPSPLGAGDYVWAGVGTPSERGPGYAGVVIEIADGALVIRFHRPVDLARLRRVEWLMPWVSTKQYDIQRAAVHALRQGNSLNRRILPLIVDGRFQAYEAPTVHQGQGKLNRAQATMIARAERVPDLLLALGPPGTGKTHTIRAIVGRQARQGKKVLITSKNNKAVDNVLEALEGVDALRIGREEAVSADVRPLMIDNRARELQAEILAKTAPALETMNRLEKLWPEIQRTLDQLVEQVNEWRLAQARVERDLKMLADWQQARYADVARAIDAQVRRHKTAYQRLHQAARQANSLRQRLDRLPARSQWPVVGRYFARQQEKLEAQWQESVQSYHQALQERDRAAHQSRETWAAYRQAASASEEALGYKRTVVDSERELDEVRAGAMQVVGQLQTATKQFDDAPPLEDAAGSLEAVEAARWQLQKWRGSLQQRRTLLQDWHELLQQRRQALYPMLIQMADVVGATCIGVATDSRFEDLEFNLAIADEAGQIQVVDLLVPLVRARRAVLVGDHRQLPPVVEHEIVARLDPEDEEQRAWLEQSLFEQIFDRDTTPSTHTVMLDTQYRMPRTIADFISERFYGGRYRTGREVSHADPFFEGPMVFIDTARERNRYDRPAEEPEGIRGYTSALEARLIAELVLAYRERGAEWGVIVPYKKQAELIRQEIHRRHPAFPQDELNDWVATVDSFQGKERDVILYGFTRSNSRGRVGFLAELRRLNVSLTRARHQLVMFGDSSTLTRAVDAPFAELMRALLTTVKALPGGYLHAHEYRHRLGS